eukprot:TRINITY_DN71_c0_g1_i1.p1 TRINITY_DN71_c0_g1~~TRINITY_DN71_c0_g1_i1.p1  ORF type:complete len:356 (+),score=76.79 TRINITY_DN71_c0_g1_i1:189-1256(+)
MLSLASIANATRSTFQTEGVEFHELPDTDLFKIFLNDEEMSKSSPDSSQSGPVSSPESEFGSPPSSPTSPTSPGSPTSPCAFSFGSKAERQNLNIVPSSFWNVSIKEEPKDSDSSSHELDSSYDLDLKKEPFALSREDLLKLSSKSLETYAQNLAATRPLTEEEERQLKRQRRLIKNRESAQLSRQRKRLYIEELEKRVSGLSADNNDLVKQLALLTSENQTLKEEMFHLQNFIKQSPVLISSGAPAAKRPNLGNSTTSITPAVFSTTSSSLPSLTIPPLAPSTTNAHPSISHLPALPVPTVKVEKEDKEDCSSLENIEGTKVGCASIYLPSDPSTPDAHQIPSTAENKPFWGSL